LRIIYQGSTLKINMGVLRLAVVKHTQRLNGLDYTV
jgi:hypothetical protein